MATHDVRQLAESEFRSANSVFMGALNFRGSTDAEWASRSRRFHRGRVWGDFVDGELAGTTLSLPSTVTVPGGAQLPAAAVSGVGVRADRTRRGVLTRLMAAQLANVRDRGEPIAMLHASETAIYPRFGYGVATRSRTVELNTHHASMRPEAPGDAGSVRLVDVGQARKLLPEAYRRVAGRPGVIARDDSWWESGLGEIETSGENTVLAVHTDADGAPDGFARWIPRSNDHRFSDGLCTLEVQDLQGADVAAVAGLWRFLLGIDLADRVMAADRPVDEPLEWWLTDSRQCRVRALQDDLWLRLVDVPTALAARSYGDAEPVVVQVRDRFLPENSGSYRIGPGGVERVDAATPQIGLDVDVLGSLYLGDVAVSTLAAANRLDVHDSAALADADRLFGTLRPPWCGTPF